MPDKPLLITLLFLALSSLVNLSIYAQTAVYDSEISEPQTIEIPQGRFFIAPVAEASYYGRHAPAIGGGLTFGYGSGTVVGIQALYSQAFGDHKVTAFELTGFFRFSIPDLSAEKGLFLRINAGLALFSVDEALSFPANGGGFSAGLAAGWRFLLNDRFYIEPYIKGGYPFLGGVGLLLGVKL